MTTETAERDPLSLDEGIVLLDELFGELGGIEQRTESLQFDIGIILWRIDPQSEEDWDRIAKRYGKSVSLLKIWLRTAARLREPKNGMSFAAMAELARVPDMKGREAVLSQRPGKDWTQQSMRAAVNKHLWKETGGEKGTVKRPQTRAGCRAYLDDEHIVAVTVRITENFAEVEVQSTLPLEDGEIHTRNPERHVIEFSW